MRGQSCRRALRALALLALPALLALTVTAARAAVSLFDIQEPWVDDAGRRVSLQQWRGKAVVMAMEYSECRFVCSVYWRRLQQVQQEADRLGLPLEFVILSIDPEHDSPAAWRDYRKARDLARGNWHFLTASRAATNRAAGLLGVRWWYFEGHLMHDFKVVRLDTQGGIAATLSSYDQPVGLLLGR